MSDNKTGGPAFPLVAQNWHKTGMTLRDYFAAHAMQAFIIASASLKEYEDHSFQNAVDSGFGAPTRLQNAHGEPYSYSSIWAEEAYEFADHMIEQRGKV